MNKLTLEKAKELCKGIKGANGGSVLIGEVSPMVTFMGVRKSEDNHKEDQVKVNKQGLLLVEIMEGLQFKEGDIVIIAPGHEPFYTTSITTDELVPLDEKVKEQFLNKEGRFENMIEADKSAFYKKYIIFVFHPIAFGAVIDNINH